LGPSMVGKGGKNLDGSSPTSRIGNRMEKPWPDKKKREAGS